MIGAAAAPAADRPHPRLGRRRRVDSLSRRGQRRAGRMSALAMPMVRNDVAVGVVGFTRAERRAATPTPRSPCCRRSPTRRPSRSTTRACSARSSSATTSWPSRSSCRRPTSEVLQLISDNPGDLQAVFDGIVSQAARLCDADGAAHHALRDDECEFVAISGERPGRHRSTSVPNRRGVDVTPQPRVHRRRIGLARRPGSTAPAGSGACERADVRRRRALRADQRDPLRGAPVRRRGTAGSSGVRRAGGDRGRQRPPVLPARGADPHRRGGQRREGLVPRHDEPRDPHADERRDRDERAAARHRAVRRASASSPRSSARAASHCSASSTTSSTSRRSTPDASSSRLTRSICGPASSRRSTSSPSRPPARASSSPSSSTRPCPTASERRRHSLPPGAREPARQRGEVHRGR